MRRKYDISGGRVSFDAKRRAYEEEIADGLTDLTLTPEEVVEKSSVTMRVAIKALAKDFKGIRLEDIVSLRMLVREMLPGKMFVPSKPGPDHCVYVLIDPRTDEIRYVGETCDPGSRKVAHLSTANGAWGRERSMGFKKRQWVIDLKAEGLEPKFEIVARCTFWDRYEDDWTRAAVRLGHPVMNFFATLPPGPSIGEAEAMEALKRLCPRFQSK